MVGELLLPKEEFVMIDRQSGYTGFVCELRFEAMRVAFGERIPVFPKNDDVVTSLGWRANLLGPSFVRWFRQLRDDMSVYDVLQGLIEDRPYLAYQDCAVRNRIVQQAIKRAVLPAFGDSSVRQFRNSGGVDGIMVRSDIGIFAHVRRNGLEYVIYSGLPHENEFCDQVLSHVRWAEPTIESLGSP
jgi:hypothetical protein